MKEFRLREKIRNEIIGVYKTTRVADYDSLVGSLALGLAVDKIISAIKASPLDVVVKKQNGIFTIMTSKQEDDESGIYFIAHSTFLGKYSCHVEGKTRLEAVKKYLQESLDFIELLETRGHRESLNQDLEQTEIEW